MPGSVTAQKALLQEVRSWSDSQREFTTDHLGNIYTFSDHIMRKYDESGNQLFVFSDKNFGHISHIDVNNPYKILLFSATLQKILILDNTLSPKSEVIDLQMLGLNTISLVAVSLVNGIWLYDGVSRCLIRVDEKMNILFSTVNLEKLTGLSFTPYYMMESDNYLYLATSEGLLVFDLLGSYIKRIALGVIGAFQIKGNYVYFWQDDRWCRYHLITAEKSCEKFLGLTTRARIEKQGLIDRSGEKIIVYKWEEGSFNK